MTVSLPRIALAALACMAMLSGCGKNAEQESQKQKADAERALAKTEEALAEAESKLEALSKKVEDLSTQMPAESARPSTPPASGEPTEAEMRQAVQDRIDMVNENIQRMRTTEIRENDPISALMRLGGEMMGDTKMSIGAFRKLGAVPAAGMPGFMCTYLLQLHVEGGNNPAVANFMNSYGGEHVTARFIKDGDAWVFISSDQENGRR